MARLNNLAIGTSLKLTGLTKGLNKASSKIQKFSMKLPKLGLAGGVAAGNLIAGGISKGISSLGGLFSDGIQIAIDAEQTEIAFTTLLGSADQAKKTLGELSDFAAATPYKLPELTDAAQQLSGSGIQADDLVSKLEMLGSVASGLNKPLGEFSAIFSKVAATDKLNNEGIIQLAERGVPIYDELGKILGTNAKGVEKLASEGKLGFKELDQAFKNMTGEGGKFEGLLEKQSQSIGGLFSTLSGKFDTLKGDLVEGFFEAFNVGALINRAISFMNGLKPVIDTMLAKIASFEPVFTAAIDVSISVLGVFFDMFANIFNAIGSIFTSVFGSFASKGESTIKTIVGYLALVEFGFLNWKKVASTVILGVAFQAVKAFNQMLHIGSMMWENLNIAGHNYGDGIATIAINIFQRFKNLGKNIRAIMGAIFSGDIFSSDFNLDKILTPINDGLIEFSQKDFVVEPRVEGDLEKNLRETFLKNSSELLGDSNKFVKDKIDNAFPKVDEKIEEAVKAVEEIPPPPPTVTDPDAPPTPGTPQEKRETQFSSIADVGSAESRKILLANRFSGRTEQDEQVDISKKQLDVAEKSLEFMKRNMRSNNETVVTIPT